MATLHVYTRRPFQYDQYILDAGQTFTMHDARNDEALIRLGYVMPVEGKAKLAQCGKCGGKFIDAAALDRHGYKRHSRPEPADEMAALEAAEAEDRLMDRMAPLYTDRAKGARA